MFFNIESDSINRKMYKSNKLEISSDLIRSVLHETIAEKLNTNNFEFVMSHASTEGETNFIGIIYRVSIKQKNEMGNDEKSEWSL